tara:strand:+ start:37436 stop:37597 length:162 start_codon:yes stop_codon:yes gene_type:complete
MKKYLPFLSPKDDVGLILGVLFSVIVLIFNVGFISIIRNPETPFSGIVYDKTY